MFVVGIALCYHNNCVLDPTLSWWQVSTLITVLCNPRRPEGQSVGTGEKAMKGSSSLFHANLRVPRIFGDPVVVSRSRRKGDERILIIALCDPRRPEGQSVGAGEKAMKVFKNPLTAPGSPMMPQTLLDLDAIILEIFFLQQCKWNEFR